MKVAFSRLCFLLLVSSLVGCAGSAKPSRSASSDELGPSIPRGEILENFAIYTRDGSVGAPRLENSGRAPFAVLLHLPERGARGQCNITNAGNGIGITGGHCVGAGQASARDLFLIYFDKTTGEQMQAPVEKVLFQGRVDYDDVALVQFGNQVKNGWDFVSQNFVSQVRQFDAKEFDQLKPVVETVTAWTLDPLASHPEVISRAVTAWGAVFSPKVCRSSRMVPWVAAVTDGKRERPWQFYPDNKTTESQTHFFFDGCSLQQGNSGALFTNQAGDKMVGIFHWLVPKARFERNEDWFGNFRKWQNVWNSVPGDDSAAVMQIGTALESLFRLHPELSAHFAAPT